MNDETLATELLREVKAAGKRWFVAFIVTLSLWFATIGLFIWYITLPVDEYTIEQESDNESKNMVIGGDYNGIKTEDNTETQGD